MRTQRHMPISLIIVGMLVSMTNANTAHASMATSDELAAAQDWFAARFAAEKPAAPFSFTYGGQSSSELLKTWRAKRTQRALDEHRAECTLTYTDPKTGLIVRCVAVQWKGFPTVEWTLFFENPGSSDTPILENIQAMDVTFERPDAAEFVLHHNRGDICAPNSFEPLEAVLEPSTEKHFAPDGGRPTNGQWPYYNLAEPRGGVIIAIGWPGQWASTFTETRARGCASARDRS